MLETGVETQFGQMKYWLLVRWSLGLLFMSAVIFILHLDMKKRNSHDVFIQLGDALLFTNGTVHNLMDRPKPDSHVTGNDMANKIESKYRFEEMSYNRTFQNFEKVPSAVPESSVLDALSNGPGEPVTLFKLGGHSNDNDDGPDDSLPPVTSNVRDSTITTPKKSFNLREMAATTEIPLAVSFLESQGDVCDPDIDPIMILLDWAQFYVEVVYEIMEKTIKKIRDEESSQNGSASGFSLSELHPHMSPGEAILYVNKLVQTHFHRTHDGVDDPDPEFRHRSSGSPKEHSAAKPQEEVRKAESKRSVGAGLAGLLREAIHRDSSNIPMDVNVKSSSKIPEALFGVFNSPEHSGSEQLASILREAISGSAASFLEVELSETLTAAAGMGTGTGFARWLIQIFLWWYNVLMKWGGTIVLDKDEKMAGLASLLELDEGLALFASPPSSPEIDPPTWQDAVGACHKSCPHRECIHGEADENLEYYRRMTDKMEHEANRRGYGSIKHLPAPPAPGGAFSKESDDGSGWSAHRTVEMSRIVKEMNSGSAVTPHGSRPLAATLGADCGEFFRKAIWTMIVMGWMTWWGMYYTILVWLKMVKKDSDV